MGKKRKANSKSINSCSRTSICPHVHTHTLVNQDIDGCYNCCLIHYSGGELRKIESHEESEQGIHVMQTYLDQVKHAGEILNANIYYKDFNTELELFQNDLDLLKTRLLKAIDSKANFEFSKIKADIFKLKQKFDESQLFISYARLDAHKCVSQKLDLSFDSFEDTQYHERFLAAKEKLAKNHQENLKKESENIKKQAEEKYKNKVDKYKNELKSQNSEVEQLKGLNKKLSEEYAKLSGDFNKYKELYAKSIQSNKDIIEDCKMQVEELMNKKNVLKNGWKLITNFYQEKTGKEVADMEKDFNFELDLNKFTNCEVLSLMKEVKIPDCKRIKFECITDNNTDVAEFLTYSLPDKLNFFVFNYGNGEVLLDSSYYIKGLINAAKATTTEMFITEVDFSSADFQSLFKACAHIENLIFCYCNLDLTSQLDLKGPEYVIQYLSFEMCGESHSNNWKNNKKRFKKLLKAIAESNVKNTLQTLNICDCGLEIEQVEDMLKSLQMYPQVEVIRESCPPIEE